MSTEAMRKMATTTPGMKPAAKRAGTETSAMPPYTMNAMLGGMTMARPEVTGHGGGGEGLVVAALDHGGNEDEAEGGHGGGAVEPLTAPQKVATPTVATARPPVMLPTRVSTSMTNAGRDARAFHDEARENEERNGEQRHLGDAGKEVVGEHVDAHVPPPADEDGGNAERDGYGHAEDERNDEGDEKPEGRIVKK